MSALEETQAASGAAGARNFRKRARSASESSEEEAAAAPVKRAAGPAHKGGVIASSRSAISSGGRDVVNSIAAVSSSRDASRHTYGGDAFAELDVDTARDRDARAVLERSVAVAQAKDGASTDSGPKLYQGRSAYASFTGVREDAASRAKLTGTYGPVRAPTNVRSSIRIDYQPDICKDYKETGFCTYGDSCIYLHDRGDYLAGWQLDRLAEAEAKKKKEELAAKLHAQGSDDVGADEDASVREDTDTDGLPFACHICRGPFKAPVVTQCKHYFCESCAVRRYARVPGCAVCGAPVSGLFATATKLLARMKQRGEADDARDKKSPQEASGGWAVVQDDVGVSGAATTPDAHTHTNTHEEGRQRDGEAT